MSLSQNYPDIRSVWMNDYANAGVIDPRCSFSRSDSTPSDVHFWSSEDHVSSENLIPKSDPSQSWQKIRTLRTTSGSFLNGSDSHLVSESSETGAHYIAPNTGVGNSTDFTSGTEYTAVLYAKSGTDDILQLAFPSSRFGTNVYANYDLSNASTTPVTGSGATATITELGSGWVKLTLVGTCTSSGIALGFVVGFVQNDINGARLPSYVGDTASNVYIWEGNVSSVGQKFLVETDGQIHREYAATLKSVAYSGQPRFEYEPTGDREAKGLLIESSSSNLIDRSYEIDNAYWSKQNTTVTAAAAVGVTGALNACLITEIEDVSPATSVHSVYSSSFGLSSATSCTFSVYCKAAGVNRVQLLTTVGGSVRNAVFNIADGSVVSESSATGAIESVGNGFYRISITYTAPATTNGRAYLNLINDSGTSNYAGNGYNSVIASAFQFEQNAFPSSYIATSGSASTRTRDQLSIDDSSLFSGNEGTVVFEGQTLGGSTGFGRFWSVSDGTNDNRIHVYPTSSTTVRFRVYRNGTEERNVATTVTDVTDNNRYAFGYEDNKLRLAQNGSLLRDDSNSAVMPVVNKLSIGMNPSGSGNQMNGYVKRIAFYNESLTDTELQSLTS